MLAFELVSSEVFRKTYRTRGVKDLYSKELGFLGHTIGLRPNGTGTVGAVTIAVRVLAIASEVGKETCTALKLGMSSVDASVDDVNTCARSGSAVICVGGGTGALMGDTTETPCSRRLSGVGPLLNILDLAKVCLDDRVLLDIGNTRKCLEKLDDIIVDLCCESAETLELIDVSRILGKKFKGVLKSSLKVLVL